MSSKSLKSKLSISDLPTEVIEKHVLVYLCNKDVESFGMTENIRFKKIADTVLSKRSK